MSGRRFAILIASSKFPNEPALSPLRFPENDVDGLSEVLRSEDRGNFDDVVVLKNVPHHEATLEIHKILSEARKDDLVLIYYSGHGKVNSQRRLHLTMSDTVINALGYTSIPIDTIRSLTEEFPSINRKVIILDCCYSGLAGDAFTRKGSLDDQFKAMFGGSGTFLMTASTAIQESLERPEDQYGVFTKHIIEGIRSGEADPDNHGVITMNDLYHYVDKRVRAEGCGQEPMKWDLEVRGGGLVIAKSGKTPKEERRQKIRAKLIGVADHLSDHILSEAIRINASDISEENSGYMELLHQLADNRLKLVDFGIKWDKLSILTKPRIEVVSPKSPKQASSPDPALSDNRPLSKVSIYIKRKMV